MLTSFPRAMRTMHQQTSGGSAAMLLIATLLLGGWLAWLMLAQIPVYLVQETAVLTEPTLARAAFPQEDLLRLKPGQTGILQLAAVAEPIPVTVIELDETVEDGRFSVVLELPQSSLPLRSGLTGRLEIEVERLTPFSLLLRLGR